MTKTVKCSSCAAEYDAALTKCPYCGELNYNAAEREYLDKLDDVREDLEDLGDVPVEETKAQAGAQGRRIFRIIRRTAIVLGAFVVVIALLNWWEDRSDQRDQRSDYLWKQENYPTMDAYYEAGDYEGLYAFIREANEQGRPTWDWSHYGDYDAYNTMQMVLADIEGADDASRSKFFYTTLLSDEIRLHLISSWAKPVSEQFRERYADELAAIEADLDTRWGLDEQGIEDMVQNSEYGLVDYDACEAYVKEWYQNKGEQ